MSTRPKSLDGFFGQSHIKNLLEFTLSAAKSRKTPFPHSLIVGGPGLGKTTLAQIIANELQVPIHEYMGSAIKKRIDVQNIESAISGDINAKSRPAIECDICSKVDVQVCYHKAGYNYDGSVSDWTVYKPAIIFCDEIHAIPKKIQEMFYSMMEDRIYFTGEINASGNEKKYWIPLFTLIGATTNSGSLTKPFFDRFQLKLNLKNYEISECIEIIKSNCLSQGMACDEDAAREIASRSDGVPRVLESLAKSVVDTAVVLKKNKITKQIVEIMFDLNNIDANGLPEVAHRILKNLMSIAPKATGLDNLAVALNEDAKYLSDWIEPRLIQKGLIERSPKGRFITSKGIDYIRPYLNQEKENKSGREI